MGQSAKVAKNNYESKINALTKEHQKEVSTLQRKIEGKQGLIEKEKQQNKQEIKKEDSLEAQIKQQEEKIKELQKEKDSLNKQIAEIEKEEKAINQTESHTTEELKQEKDKSANLAEKLKGSE